MTNQDAKTKTTEGIAFQKDGSIDLVAGSIAHHLEPATLKQFREVKKMLLTMSREVAELAGISLGDLQVGRTDGVDPELLLKAEEVLEERNVDVVSAIFPDLPKDSDEWPAWLATDSGLSGRVLAHWRTVPLGPGS